MTSQTAKQIDIPLECHDMRLLVANETRVRNAERSGVDQIRKADCHFLRKCWGVNLVGRLIWVVGLGLDLYYGTT
jgi:hypothetical protein